jgi:hypothetical protein
VEDTQSRKGVGVVTGVRRSRRDYSRIKEHEQIMGHTEKLKAGLLEARSGKGSDQFFHR